MRIAGDFFNTGPAGPAALGIAGPQDAAEIALGVAGAGNLDGSLADKISQLGTGAGVSGQRLGKHRHRDRRAVTRRPAT